MTELARATLCWRAPDCEVVMNTAVLTRQDAAATLAQRRQR